ncbi:hypothetical protein ACHWQZ_G019627 [Mnemiopsis leidyi]
MPKVRGEEWAHVSEKGFDRHRNALITCNYCERCFCGSAFKIRNHLMTCVSAPIEVITEMRNKSVHRAAVNVSNAGVRRNITQAGLKNQLTIRQMSESSAREKLDESIADFFFETGKRWTDLHVPVHSAAYILNPSFVRYPIFDDKSIIDDFKEFVRDCGFNTAKALQELERYRLQMYWFQITTNILIAAAALLGNYFVFKYYSISRTKLVSMLYSSIAVVDSIGSVTALLQVISFLLVELKVERSTSRIDKDLFGVYLYLLVTLFSVTSRVSCFLNAVLAVSRAIAVWKPFYRIKFKRVFLSIILYTCAWILFMLYVGIEHFFLENKRAIECSTVNQCIVGLIPADIIYGIPYVVPTVIVMAALGVTLWCLKRSRGMLHGKTVEEQRALREAAMSRTTKTIIILSVVFLICNVTFAVFGGVMFLYTTIHGKENINKQVYLILFFISHYTVVYFNAALNPGILILRSTELTSFTKFHLFELLHKGTCGLVKEKRARTRRESMSATARMSCSILDNSGVGGNGSGRRVTSCAATFGKRYPVTYTRSASHMSFSNGSPTQAGSPENISTKRPQSSADLLKSCSQSSNTTP